jgi:hypothetical protein
MIEPHLA